MGFLNKPVKALKGGLNKVVREIDRVCLSKKRFQAEYAKQPSAEVIPEIEDTNGKVDHEHPQYLKRNKCGLMIPMPEYFPEYKYKFVIFSTDSKEIIRIKESFNGHKFSIEYYGDSHDITWLDYIINAMKEMKGHRGKDFRTIISNY
jgi:hypothetical protein